jgi:serine/threonine protein kinase
MSDTSHRGAPGGERAGHHRLALPAGRALGEYQIERVLGVGPFGATYLATDAGKKRVVIREYLPSDIVTREGLALRGETAADDDLLRRGRERFLSEGKRLQRVKHASIVRVHDAFEANNTGYLVFEHESGETLSNALTGAHTLADEPLLRRFAFTLLDALEAVHEAAFLHGKVEPSNILLRSDGTPVLLDFGAARAATGLTRRASIALVPGFAAIEQYTSHEAQGPWTDMYGLAAVLYRVITGKDPLDAPARLLEDRLMPAEQAGSGRYSRSFLRAIDAALVVRPEDRPQTVAEWRPMLDKTLAPKALEARDPENVDDEDDYVPDYGTPQERSRTWIYATAGVVSVLVLGTLALAGIGYMANNANDPRRAAVASNPAAPSPARDQVMPLPPAEDAAAREARMREDERRVAEQIAATRAAEEQRARDAARQREEARQEQARQEQERQSAATRQTEEQRRAAQQQEQARQLQARQEQARQEQERQAAAARAAEEARQREAVVRQEQAKQEQARQEAARQEAARAEQAKQEQARQEAARAEQAKQEQERQAAARAAEEAQQRAAAAQQQEQARQEQATRVAEEIRQRELVRQQEQSAAARTLEEARVREQARAPEAPRAATTTGSAMLLPPPAPAGNPAAAPSIEAGRSGGTAPVPLTGPVASPPAQAAPQQMARATTPPLVQPPAPRPESAVATPAPVARVIDVGRIDAVNWQWGYVVMQMEQRQGMQVGDRVYARSGDTKLWMTVRRVSGTQVSAVPDSDLQRYSVNGRVYKD